MRCPSLTEALTRGGPQLNATGNLADRAGKGQMVGWTRLGSHGFVTFVILVSIATAVHFATGSRGLLDVEKDWLTTRAAWDGTGAHIPVPELAGRYGSVHQAPPETVHPRTPGALLLQSPIALIPQRALPIVWAVASAVALVVAVLGFGAFVGLTAGQSSLWLLVLFASPATWSAFASGTQSPWLAALLLSVPCLLARDRRPLAGLALGTAITLKLFPVLLAPLLLRAKRKQVLWWAGGVFVGLNGLGLLLPGVEVHGSLAAITSGTGPWFDRATNASLAWILHSRFGLASSVAIPLGALLVLPGIAVLAAGRWTEAWVLPVWVLAAGLMLLATPNSWIHYDLVLFGGVLIMASVFRHHWPILLVGTVAVLFGWIPLIAGAEPGEALGMSRMAIAGLMAWVLIRRRRDNPVPLG